MPSPDSEDLTTRACLRPVARLFAERGVEGATIVKIAEPEGHLRLLSAKPDFYPGPVLCAKVAEQARTVLDRLQFPRVQR